MTIDRVAMKELLEKGTDQDLLREMLAFVASRMMDVEVESLTGAAHGECSPERTTQRNGYRTRNWHTGVGTAPVAIRSCKGSYFPSFLEPRRSADKAMIAVMQEAYVHGISTRSVDDLVKAMGMTGISKSQVSRLCEEIDGCVKEFLNRPIEGTWPYVWIDRVTFSSASPKRPASTRSPAPGSRCRSRSRTPSDSAHRCSNCSSKSRMRSDAQTPNCRRRHAPEPDGDRRSRSDCRCAGSDAQRKHRLPCRSAQRRA